MELSWSTFVLEIINFLVLVWILKRFLYKPVLDVIARRQTGIEERLTESRHLHEEAKALKAEYEDRLAQWEQERRHARDTLAVELEAERTRQTTALQAALSEEQKKARVAESRQRAEAVRETEHKALQHGAQFATRLLTQAAGPELEARLLELLQEKLNSLTDEQITVLRNQWGEPPESIEVSSAYTLTEDQRQQLEKTLSTITGLAATVNYNQDTELLAGLRINIGPWVLRANVQDELQAFAEFAHAAR
ncbi:F0F1 ATP synthase subunit delta [Kaarinaea lacus]